MIYKAVIWLEENKTFSVSFPDLEGCFTMAESLEEAKEYAKEALDLYLEDNPTKGFQPPSTKITLETYQQEASYHEIIDVSVNKTKAFALKLRWLRKELGLTQKVLATRLNIGLYAYQRLENPKKSNATIKTIQEVETCIQKELVSI